MNKVLSPDFGGRSGRRPAFSAGLAAACALLLLVRFCPAQSGVVTLTFEGLQNNEPIQNYYNGGYGGLGSGPGPNYGVTFGPDSLSIISIVNGGGGNFTGNPSGDTTAYFRSGPGVVMNVANGFQNGFSFYYASGGNTGTVTVADKSGNPLRSISIGNGSYCDGVYVYSCWTAIGVTFSGTAYSVSFGGATNGIGFDNITLGNSVATSALKITNASLLAGTVGFAYNAQLAATGGTAPYTWTQSGLPPGLTFSSGGAISGIPSTPGTFPVSFTVKDSSSPPLTAVASLPLTVSGVDNLAANPSTVTLSNTPGGGKVTTTSILTNPGTASTSFGISSSTSSGGNWLSATAPTNTIAVGGSVTVTITVDTTFLAPGNYSGTVKITGMFSSASITANADVAGGISISAAPNPINLGLITAQKQAPITLTVTAAGGQEVVSVGTSIPPGQPNWLTTDAPNGSVTAGPSALFHVMVDASSLAPAAYAGNVTLQCNPSGACAEVQVPVIFTVVTLTPATLSFTAGPNNTLPAVQTAQIATSNATPASFALTVASPGNWLKATANQSTTPATLTVSLASLPAQDSAGTVTIQQTASPATVPPNQPATVIITVNYKSSPALPLPVITSVFNAAGYQPGLTPQTFISITGSNLTTGITDNWNNSFVGNQLPTSIDGVMVTIGGKFAYPNYISPTQINAVAPDVGYGSMTVTVTTPNGTSAAFSTVSSQVSPAFFMWPPAAQPQPVATHGDYSLAVASGTFPGLSTIPAKPGEIISLWGTGFGPTNPAAPAGVVVPSGQAYNLPALPVLTLNNQPCVVYGAVLVNGGAAEYQVAFQVPASMPNGSWPLSVLVDGVASPTGVYLTVHN